MHLLLIQNNYGVYSGEEAVVDKQIALFKEVSWNKPKIFLYLQR